MNQKLIEDLKSLIGFQTLTEDHSVNAEAFSWIKQRIKSLPVMVSDFEFNNFPSLLIKTRKANAKVCLLAHLDVVGVDDNLFLFQAVDKDGKLFGRGAYDMKFAVASYLSVLENIGSDLSDYNFDILLTSDEEHGGLFGTRRVLETGYKPESCISPDGGENWKFEKASKGVLQYQIKSQGKANHSSRPWEGLNAISLLMGFLQELQAQFTQEPCSDSLHYHTTMNVGRISGGKAVNQIPGEAEAIIDIRFIPEVTKENIERLLKEISDKYLGISFSEYASGSSYHIDEESPFFKPLVEIIKEKTGIDREFVISHGSSDARFFAECGIPVYCFRPPGGSLHGDGEWVDLEGLDKFTQIIEAYVRKVAKY